MEKQIICRSVTKRLDRFTLYPISFELEPGYILGVIGRNGSGKTTLLRTMMGSYQLEQPEQVRKKSGSKDGRMTDGSRSVSDVLMDGISLQNDCKRYKEQIAFVMNESPFYLGSSSIENGELYGRFYTSFDMEKYHRLLEEMKIPKRQAILKLSKGQQIRQQLAFALSYDAKVYFFDEPTGNLDVAFRDTFYQYIREIVADGTKSVIYASHLVEEMEEFADYILWLECAEKSTKAKTGSMRYFGTLDDLKNNYRMLEISEKWTEQIPEDWIVGGRRRENHEEILICLPQQKEIRNAPLKQGTMNEHQLLQKIITLGRYADLKEIMYYVEKGVVI